MTLYHYLIDPLQNYGFMRRAFTACIAVALGGAPLGVFLVLRRMTLVGDAISHSILPGVSIAFLFYGLSLTAMTLGGMIAGLVIALVAGGLTRFTQLKEDASFASIYLLSLTSGVLIISLKGSAVDLMHILFGNILAIDNASLLLITCIASVSMLTLAFIYRSLIIECFDPVFMRTQGGQGMWMHQLFLVLLVLNLVSAFQAIGTLMALGIIVLPAITARFWTENIDATILFSIFFSVIASYTGLLLSYYNNLPTGPSIVLILCTLYVISVVLGRYGSIISNFFPRQHLAH